MGICRWNAVALVVAALMLAAAGPAGAQNSGGRPNVLILQTDDQTLESVRVMTNVQKLLAGKGTVFDNSFVSYSLCCPSRATLLTGQYAHNHTVMGNQPPAGGYRKLDHTNTLAVWLRDGGYHTVHLGKYLNGYGTDNPTEIPPGYDEWYASVDPSTYRFYGFTLNENGRLVTYPQDEANYQTDVYSRKGVELVRRLAPSRKPFFLWTAFLAPHSGGGVSDPDDPRNFATPEPAPRHRNRFASEPLPKPPSFNEADVSDKPAPIRNRNRFGPQRENAIRENYQQRLESLLAVDEAIFAILDALRETGELDETLIVFTSDNGFFHGEYRIQNGKVFAYEPSIRVPLVLRGPGVARGLRLPQLVSNQDLAVTIADAAGVERRREVDGRSLLPLIDDRQVDYGRDLLVEAAAGQTSFAALRSRRYLYVEWASGERELYDLVVDPNQLLSRHADPAYDAIEAELARRLANLRTCRGSSCLAHPRLAVSLRYARGRTRSGKTCARSDVVALLRGEDAERATSAEFYVDGRRLGGDRSRPFAVRIRRRHLDRGGVSKVRVPAELEMDRSYAPARSVRVCR
jgi:N-acetylglucosamine-6-sulfatase